MNIMQKAEQFINDTQLACASEKISYLPHGASSAISVDAVVGRSFFSTSSVSGYQIHSRTLDFIVRISQLGAVSPARGDAITRQNGQKYEVCAPDGEPCWRYSGGERDTYRIHAQEVAE